jgi:hypothetical protein
MLTGVINPRRLAGSKVRLNAALRRQHSVFLRLTTLTSGNFSRNGRRALPQRGGAKSKPQSLDEG